MTVRGDHAKEAVGTPNPDGKVRFLRLPQDYSITKT